MISKFTPEREAVTEAGQRRRLRRGVATVCQVGRLDCIACRSVQVAPHLGRQNTRHGNSTTKQTKESKSRMRVKPLVCIRGVIRVDARKARIYLARSINNNGRHRLRDSSSVGTHPTWLLNIWGNRLVAHPKVQTTTTIMFGRRIERGKGGKEIMKEEKRLRLLVSPCR